MLRGVWHFRLSPFARPPLSLSLLANAIREQPSRVRICAALDGRGLGCRALVGDGSQAVDAVAVGEGSNGFGHQMHAFEVWLAAADDDENGTGTTGAYTTLMSVNATSVFSSAPPGAMHMPDDLEVYHSQCFYEGADSTQASSHAELDASAEGTASAASSGSARRPSRTLPLARGVLHIGANVANEAKGYAACVGGGGGNVLFVECDPDVARACAANARKFGQRCINVRSRSYIALRRCVHL